ncbi:hypothetical protein K491DRAFT_277986 [Lophiostoma macrostomum CBS 122681]|uniref:Uncharacterized protein n=1 Tax=Lophiostoma macrostomum CBS 122681 TaxID=1314788 RepID=A0A6A6SNR0_9PLEO|nr:hypothetical protein K491DRAFT_277986 [Lophiostoma macrostomum CBS 122681]
MLFERLAATTGCSAKTHGMQSKRRSLVGLPISTICGIPSPYQTPIVCSPASSSMGSGSSARETQAAGQINAAKLARCDFWNTFAVLLDMATEPDHWPVRRLAACGRLFTATQARGDHSFKTNWGHDVGSPDARMLHVPCIRREACITPCRAHGAGAVGERCCRYVPRLRPSKRSSSAAHRTQVDASQNRRHPTNTAMISS